MSNPPSDSTHTSQQAKLLSLSNLGLALILGFSFILGMAVFALFGASGLKSVKRMEEYVTVKGLSERVVPANLAIWPISFVVANEDLTLLQSDIQKSRDTVRAFLLQNGFMESEISNGPPMISDTLNAAQSEDSVRSGPRYRAQITVLLRSEKIAEVKHAMETCDKLVKQKIVLGGNNYVEGAQFIFTGLNQIKPDMIQEATRNARLAAERFAVDSDSKAGKIRRAVQGTFEVYDLDSSTPDKKIVRVVTTVDFYLR